ncbi:MAG: hypothetical protein GY810_28645 [Aureispira sp.]|nr:hypothetical protein [Aureispira sp.]
MKTGITVGLIVVSLLAMFIAFLVLLEVPTIVLFLTIPILSLGGLVIIFGLPFLVISSENKFLA